MVRLKTYKFGPSLTLITGSWKVISPILIHYMSSHITMEFSSNSGSYPPPTSANIFVLKSISAI